MSVTPAPMEITEELLRTRFAAADRFEPVTEGDGHLWEPDTDIRAAAVLVPIIRHVSNFTVLFTKRASHLAAHAAQISFPGGRVEAQDNGPDETALRETMEEIGIPPQRIEILGHLSAYLTVTGYRVIPVVGLIHAPIALQLDPCEVAEVFEVPLSFLLDPQNHQRHTVIASGRQRHYYALPYQRYYIWGATAGMLMNLWRYIIR